MLVYMKMSFCSENNCEKNSSNISYISFLVEKVSWLHNKNFVEPFEKKEKISNVNYINQFKIGRSK